MANSLNNTQSTPLDIDLYEVYLDHFKTICSSGDNVGAADIFENVYTPSKEVIDTIQELKLNIKDDQELLAISIQQNTFQAAKESFLSSSEDEVLLHDMSDETGSTKSLSVNGSSSNSEILVRETEDTTIKQLLITKLSEMGISEFTELCNSLNEAEDIEEKIEHIKEILGEDADAILADGLDEFAEFIIKETDQILGLTFGITITALSIPLTFQVTKILYGEGQEAKDDYQEHKNQIEQVVFKHKFDSYFNKFEDEFSKSDFSYGDDGIEYTEEEKTNKFLIENKDLVFALLSKKYFNNSLPLKEYLECLKQNSLETGDEKILYKDINQECYLELLEELNTSLNEAIDINEVKSLYPSELKSLESEKIDAKYGHVETTAVAGMCGGVSLGTVGQSIEAANLSVANTNLTVAASAFNLAAGGILLVASSLMSASGAIGAVSDSKKLKAIKMAEGESKLDDFPKNKDLEKADKLLDAQIQRTKTYLKASRYQNAITCVAQAGMFVTGSMLFATGVGVPIGAPIIAGATQGLAASAAMVINNSKDGIISGGKEDYYFGGSDANFTMPPEKEGYNFKDSKAQLIASANELAKAKTLSTAFKLANKKFEDKNSKSIELKDFEKRADASSTVKENAFNPISLYKRVKNLHLLKAFSQTRTGIAGEVFEASRDTYIADMEAKKLAVNNANTQEKSKEVYEKLFKQVTEGLSMNDNDNESVTTQKSNSSTSSEESKEKDNKQIASNIASLIKDSKPRKAQNILPNLRKSLLFKGPSELKHARCLKKEVGKMGKDESDKHYSKSLTEEIDIIGGHKISAKAKFSRAVEYEASILGRNKEYFEEKNNKFTQGEEHRHAIRKLYRQAFEEKFNNVVKQGDETQFYKGKGAFLKNIRVAFGGQKSVEKINKSQEENQSTSSEKQNVDDLLTPNNKENEIVLYRGIRGFYRNIKVAFKGDAAKEKIDEYLEYKLEKSLYDFNCQYTQREIIKEEVEGRAYRILEQNDSEKTSKLLKITLKEGVCKY